MGMYTELVLGVSIKKDSPIVPIIQAMVDRKQLPYTPNHSLFRTTRYTMIFHCCSYYFDGQPHVTFRYDEIAQCWYLTTRFNLKNYNNEIEEFCNWIAPHVEEQDELAGYKRYEEDRYPSLLYFEDGKAIWYNISSLALRRDVYEEWDEDKSN